MSLATWIDFICLVLLIVIVQVFVQVNSTMSTMDPMEIESPKSSDTKKPIRVQTIHIVEPDSIFTKAWLFYQIKTVNLGNVALLVTLFLISSSIKDTLRRQEAQNAIAFENNAQSKLYLDSVTSQLATMEQTLNATQILIADFESFIVASDLNSSVAYMQGKDQQLQAMNQTLTGRRLHCESPIEPHCNVFQTGHLSSPTGKEPAETRLPPRVTLG